MAPPHEPTVRSSAPMPPGYAFVPKGNVYITSHCRKQAQAAGQTVFLVVRHDTQAKAKRKPAPIGIRVPAAVHAAVRAAHDATRDARADAVRRRDARLEADFRAAVLAQFPRAPPASLALVVDRAMRKGSRRVGRAGSGSGSGSGKIGLAVEDKAVLAVRAHIRHAHTDYDRLLRGDGDGGGGGGRAMTREQARAETYGRIDEVVREWGGAPSKPRPKSKPKLQRRKQEQRGGGGKDGRPQKQQRGNSARAAIHPRNAVAVKATATTAEKPTRGSPRKPGKAAAATAAAAATSETASGLRREKKQVVRRASATAAAKGESPEAQRELGQLRTRSGRRYSLLDDGDNESDEFEWSSWDEDSEDEDDISEG
ncbi:hypothetical protein SLS62_007798 [Diatrype stigma]|uniref:DUF2293 domain-containing protein n=1 Tax=Diatrype stigma TaxID=117547 RepID=A0AAN9UM49_9PEZI